MWASAGCFATLFKQHTCCLPGAVATLSKVFTENEAPQRVARCKDPCLRELCVDLLDCKVNIVCEAGTIDGRAGQLQAGAASIVKHHRPPPLLRSAAAHPFAVAFATATCEGKVVAAGEDAECTVRSVKYRRQQTASNKLDG